MAVSYFNEKKKRNKKKKTAKKMELFASVLDPH